jgi:hypothetical protein
MIWTKSLKYPGHGLLQACASQQAAELIWEAHPYKFKFEAA